MLDNHDDVDPLDPDLNHFNDTVVKFSPHSIDSFEKSNLNPNALNIMHHNSRSIMKTGKLEEYELFFKSINNPFSILVFTETWLTNDKVDLCRLQGYSPIHLLRPTDQIIDFKERGGGISISVRNYITLKQNRPQPNSTIYGMLFY